MAKLFNLTKRALRLHLGGPGHVVSGQVVAAIIWCLGGLAVLVMAAVGHSLEGTAAAMQALCYGFAGNSIGALLTGRSPRQAAAGVAELSYVATAFWNSAVLWLVASPTFLQRTWDVAYLPVTLSVPLGIVALTLVFVGAPRAVPIDLPQDGVAIDIPSRAEIDASCRQVVMAWYVSATVWLMLGSILALLASIKLHSPYFLSQHAWLTFGRVRPAHLNTMAYGWASMAGIGTTLWLQARLTRQTLPFRAGLYLFCFYWNAALAYGTWGILSGHSSGVEWLELPPYVAVALSGAFIILFIASLKMLRQRHTKHLYVSQWYLFGAVFWFPCLYVTASLLIFVVPAPGTVKAVANWWFAHNVLGLWLTPIGLATAYYLIPKVLGRPIHSYYLSILGFWTVALFYNWAGTHHLIGGPLPAWVISAGIVGSVMMFIPVITVAINHHMTMLGHFHRLKRSPTLRFTVFGAMSYTIVSFQGSLTALRSINAVTHFTHYTIAHAHLGVYAFYTMIMFGAFYYIIPRLTGREWWSSRLIAVHFWCSSSGITLYFIALTWAGWRQGRGINSPEIPFIQVVQSTLPYLQIRSVAGILLSCGHLAFATLLFQMVRGQGRVMPGPTLFRGVLPRLFSWGRRSAAGRLSPGPS